MLYYVSGKVITKLSQFRAMKHQSLVQALLVATAVAPVVVHFLMLLVKYTVRQQIRMSVRSIFCSHLFAQPTMGTFFV